MSERVWHDVGALAELERTGRVVAVVAGRSVGVVRAPDGSLHGVRDRCPHHGAPLCRGVVQRRTLGTPGRYELGDRLVLRCPWHGWEFDLETGTCPEDARMRVAVYPSRIVGDRVEVALVS